MASKADELKQYARLRKELPQGNVSLSMEISSWGDSANKCSYSAYWDGGSASASGFSTYADRTLTPEEAVDLLLAKVKEAASEPNPS